MEELIGTILAGKYEIIELIGKGGMGYVFKAYDPELERDVAIKILNPDLAVQDKDSIGRFEREAKLVSRLRHPNILPIYDYGVEGDLRYYIMPYVGSRKTLRDVINQPLDLTQAIEMISPVVEALEYAHSMNVIHRDIKPTNILVDETQTGSTQLLLADFGLAKILEDSTSITTLGDVLGTPAYMSPEQIQGEEDIDHRTDIYALGVIFYQMLTGNIPHFSGNKWVLMSKRRTEPPPSHENIPEDLERVLFRALAIDPKDRYETATRFIEELREAAQQINPPPISSPTTATATATAARLTRISESIRKSLTDVFHKYNSFLTITSIIVGIGGIIVTILAIVLTVNSVDRPIDTPTSEPAIVPVDPTSTPSPTSIPATPTPTSTPSPTSIPATPTPTSTPSPTSIPVTPTPTSTPSPIPTSIMTPISETTPTFEIISSGEEDFSSPGQFNGRAEHVYRISGTRAAVSLEYSPEEADIMFFLFDHWPPDDNGPPSHFGASDHPTNDKDTLKWKGPLAEGTTYLQILNRSTGEVNYCLTISKEIITTWTCN